MDKQTKKHPSLLKGLVNYTEATPEATAYLRSFIKRLVEDAGAITVREIAVVAGLTKTKPEVLLDLCSCWSEHEARL